MSFKIGDRVQYGSSGRFKGVVLELGHSRAKVQFDDDGGGQNPAWLLIRDLRLIEGVKVKPLPLPG